MSKDNSIDRKKGTEFLKHKLTEDEKKKTSEDMAQAVEKIATYEDNLKSLSTEFKAKIAEEEALLKKSASLIRQGYEYRATPIEIEYSYAVGKVTKTRMDTIEIYEERPMTEQERQQKLIE